MGFFDRFSGKGRLRQRAKQAELRGDLASAVDLWAGAEEPDEVARVMLVQGDSELTPESRMKRYTEAASVAREGGQVKRQARVRRAELIVALADADALSGVVRRDLLMAAKELEECGEPEKAAAAYAKMKDVEGEARALAQAGDVDKLESVLTNEHEKERASRDKRRLFADAELLSSSGDRRGALLALQALQQLAPEDAMVKDRIQAIFGRKKQGPLVDLVVDGAPWKVILGNEVVIGRTEGSLLIASSAVSREHLRIGRVGDQIEVSDLKSRNGTQLRGIALTGAIPVHEGVELTLGREVPIRIAPSTRVANAVEIEALGALYVAPLGDLTLPNGWSLRMREDRWVDLLIGRVAAYFGSVATREEVSLLIGDAISKERGAPACLRVVG